MVKKYDRSYCDYPLPNRIVGVVTLVNLVSGNKERPSCLVGYWLDKNNFNTPAQFGVDDLFDTRR